MVNKENIDGFIEGIKDEKLKKYLNKRYKKGEQSFKDKEDSRDFFMEQNHIREDRHNKREESRSNKEWRKRNGW